MITDMGKHRVQRGDIMNGIAHLMQNDIADFIYSDPPWGQGNLKYWQTINKRHTGREPNQIDYNKFLPHYFNTIYEYSKDIAIIEYGVGWREDIIKIAQQAGYIHNGIITSYYGGGKKVLPLDIHVFSKYQNIPIPAGLEASISEYTGYKVVQAMFNAFCPADAEIILDPMCGMGYTAQATIDRGLKFRGNELNEKRLGKTIDRLKKSL
tara:strand:+ start:155 stop:781 length:627 start_codon:yes stop_codon:yes gene_type:complete